MQPTTRKGCALSFEIRPIIRMTSLTMMRISLIMIENSVFPQLQTSSTFISSFLHYSVPQHGDDGYVIGTNHGRLEGKYKRTSLAACHTQFLKPEEVPEDVVISLREAARLVSGGSGQGIKKCTTIQYTIQFIYNLPAVTLHKKVLMSKKWNVMW